jgi:ABC-type glycerol-3-phosphate transport system substrate-binding protein
VTAKTSLSALTAPAFIYTPHPHAALLLIDFLLSPEGQKILAEKFGYGSPRKDYRSKSWYPEQSLTTYDYAPTIERWNKVIFEIAHK